MTENLPDDFTLPSVVADLERGYGQPRLLLTIIFHPDVTRIGEQAFPVEHGSAQSGVVGRNQPGFSRSVVGSGISLGDPHISREALVIDRQADSLVLRRDSGASRCQVDGRELDGEAVLSDQQLHQGVVIFLAHRVVLLLREISWMDDRSAQESVSAELVGSSPYMCGLKRQIDAAARSDLDVLVRGETGTGKELVASAIHLNSHDTSGSLVAVNMSAIPLALAPALLFGSAKGAFTGADSASAGYFEQAEGGVLFLDEIGDTPVEIQAQLLRAIQQREIQVVGGPVRRIGLRIISATDAELESGGDFKAALRHRLGACEIVLEPLRRHPEDIGELMCFFLGQYLEEATEPGLRSGRDIDRLTVAAWAELFHVFVRYSWPGNIRQLANFCRQVTLAGGSHPTLPAGLRQQVDQPVVPEVDKSAALRRPESVNDGEFLAAMEATNYEPMATARLLNISRSAVYRRMEECGLRVAGGIPEEELQEVLTGCGGNVNDAAAVLRVSRSGLRARLRTAERKQR